MLTVSDAGTLEDCFRAISDNAKTDTGFKEMLLCLAPGWDKQRIVGEDFRTTDEEMTVVSGYRGDVDVPVQTFRKKNILPQDMLEDPNPYYIFVNETTGEIYVKKAGGDFILEVEVPETEKYDTFNDIIRGSTGKTNQNVNFSTSVYTFPAGDYDTVKLDLNGEPHFGRE